MSLPIRGFSLRLLPASLLMIFIGPLVASFSNAANPPPTLRLFPTTVVENIKETGEAAKQMEKNLQTIIQDLETQMALYRASNCEGADADSGCADIARQMTDKYMEMLEQMDSQLPTMENSVKLTHGSLEKRIKQEMGMKMTPRQLQKMLGGRQVAQKPRRRGTSPRLSEKFRRYYELVAMSPSQSGNNLSLVASEIYLDTGEVLELITMTRSEISRAKILAELNQIYGIISPEMYDTVAGVREIIFGESESPPTIPGPPPGSSPESYVSPLAK